MCIQPPFGGAMVLNLAQNIELTLFVMDTALPLYILTVHSDYIPL
jgi:hypothetical protein